MPTYEYACKFCGKHLEIYQPITDDPLKRCPSCKKLGLKRLISGGAGIIFKGTGFYETDYRRQSAPAKSETSSDKKPAESKPAESKPPETKSSDSKSAPAKPKPEPGKPPAAKSAKT